MTTLFGPHLLVRPSEPSVHGGDTRGLVPGRGEATSCWTG